jgi:hypothetical protein
LIRLRYGLGREKPRLYHGFSWTIHGFNMTLIGRKVDWGWELIWIIVCLWVHIRVGGIEWEVVVFQRAGV